MTETWKAVPGFEGLYEVSDMGRVRSLDRDVHIPHPTKPHSRRAPGRVLQLQRHPQGYIQVRFNNTSHLVHRLVAAAFHGPVGEGLEVAHLNGQRTDNRAANLALVRHRENLSHMLLHDTRLFGSRNPGAVLTEKEVAEIRSRRTRGETYKQIARDFSVTKQTVGKIARGERWTRV